MNKNFLNKTIKLVKYVVTKSSTDRIGESAAQTSFFILMSVFPFAYFLLQMMRFAPISPEDLLLFVDSIFPEYLLPTIHSILQEIYSSPTRFVTITALTTLWSASKTMHALTQGLDRIVDTQETRNWFVIRMWALIYTFAMAVIITIAIALSFLWQSLRSLIIYYRPHGVALSSYSNVIRTIYTLFILVTAFSVMYKTFPRKKLSLIRQIPGAFLASLGWYISTFVVGFYLSRSSTFSMYGSLTGLIIIMFWLYFCSYSIFIGAEINEALLHIFRQSSTKSS